MPEVGSGQQGSQLVDFEFTSQVHNHFERATPKACQTARVAPYEGPVDEAEAA